MHFNLFGKTKPKKSTYKLCCVECRGKEITVLGSHSLGEVENDGSKEYTVSVPADCYGEIAGALGGVLGRGILPSGKKRADGVNYSWRITAKDYLLIAAFEAKKSEMIAKSQPPKASPSNLSEEEMNRMPSWKAERNRASLKLFGGASRSNHREEYKPPSPDILDIGNSSEYALQF